MSVKMTPAALSRACYQAFGYLPATVLERVKANHKRAWGLVCLHDDGLATPTARSVATLLTPLWEALEAERIAGMERQALANMVDTLVREPAPEAEAVKKLGEAGAVNQRRQNAHGYTKSGWWQDGVFLAVDPVEALSLLNGD